MWKQINDCYSISNQGEVRSDRYGKILKPFLQGKYLGVWLGAGNKHYIHRLVAEAFCEKHDDKNQVDHINRNKFDNRSENLRWVSSQENMNNRDRETKCRKHNKLGEIYIHKEHDRFRVQINNKYYGTYETLEEAKNKRDSILDAIYH